MQQQQHQVVGALGAGHKNGPKFVTGNPQKFRVTGNKLNSNICMLWLAFIVRTRTKGGNLGKILQKEWPQKRPFLTATYPSSSTQAAAAGAVLAGTTTAQPSTIQQHEITRQHETTQWHHTTRQHKTTTTAQHDGTTEINAQQHTHDMST